MRPGLKFDIRCKSRYSLSHLAAAQSLLELMASRNPEKVAEEERIHFQNTITAFEQYAPYTVCPTPRSRFPQPRFY